MKRLIGVLVLSVQLCLLPFSSSFCLTPSEKETLTTLLTEYKAIQKEYKLTLESLQKEQISDKELLKKANLQLEDLNRQIMDLEETNNQDKLTLTELQTLTADLQTQTQNLKGSLNLLEIERTALLIALPIAFLLGVWAGSKVVR